jgi:hypothetical protein
MIVDCGEWMLRMLLIAQRRLQVLRDDARAALIRDPPRRKPMSYFWLLSGNSAHAVLGRARSKPVLPRCQLITGYFGPFHPAAKASQNA